MLMEPTPTDIRIRNVMGRLETIVDVENERLGSDPQFDIKSSNAHKSRCLYELTMLSRDIRGEDMPEIFFQQMKQLKVKLNTNAHKVQAHMDAVRAVSDILRNAVREADEDGTYTQERFQYSEF